MNSKETLKQHLAKTITISDDQFEYVFSHFVVERFKKGQSIIGPGDDIKSEYFVISGCLKTFYLSPDMKMYILQFAMPTWWASDYQSLYTGQKAMCGVDCITESEVLRIDNDKREKLCKEIHDIEYFFRWRTNMGYVAAQKRLLSLMNNMVKERYEELIRQYPSIYQLVPKHLIAAYLGVSRETLSRLYNDENVR
jgi:CRP-like cAMP-binding protein